MIFHIDAIENCMDCKQEDSVHFEFTTTGVLLSLGMLNKDGGSVNTYEGYCGKCGMIHTIELTLGEYGVKTNVKLTDRKME